VSTPAPRSETAPPLNKPDLAHGQQIYRQACAFCHDKGVAGAPKMGDAAAWSPRLAQGMDTLYASAMNGKNAMPAKGGNPSLADTDVKAAVDYLAAQAL
jgi:cytochrome c5